MFTAEDLKQFEKKNISQKNIEQQIENFRNGFPYINLIGAATPDNGIRVLDDEKTAVLTAAFEKAAPVFYHQDGAGIRRCQPHVQEFVCLYGR